MRERCKHLATIEDIQNSKDSEYARWVDTRLDRWIVDWVLRHGRVQTSRHIAQEKGIEVSPGPLVILFVEFLAKLYGVDRHWSILIYLWTFVG